MVLICKLLLGIAVILPTFLFFSEPVSASEKAEKIKIMAMVQESAPKYIFTDNKLRGLCGDIYSHLTKQLAEQNIRIEISNHYTPIKRILETLESRSDMIYCGASRNKGREARFEYSSQPLYHVSNILVASDDNPSDPKSIAELMLRKSTVGTYFGTGSSEFLKKSGLLRINEKYQSVERGLRSVADGEIDYFFYHDLGLLYSLSIAELPLRAVPTIFRSYPHWMIFSKTMSTHVRNRIDQVLRRMIESGLIEKIWKKYKPAVS